MLKISVIIPTYMQAVFIEECLQSVLEQTYPHKEVLVFDGGSSDGTVEILKKYDKQLDYWESIKDKGQTDAINKGLRRMQGQVWCYLNSDDLLEKQALKTVAEYFKDSKTKWLSGYSKTFSNDGIIDVRKPVVPTEKRQYLPYWGSKRGLADYVACSCATFMHRELIDTIGLMDESLHYAMDMEYYARAALAGNYTQVLCKRSLAAWRIHDNSKTSMDGIAYRFIEEELSWAGKYVDFLGNDEKAVFLSDMKREKSYMHLRKTAYWLSCSKNWNALKSWLSAVIHYPVNFGRRWWLSLGIHLFKNAIRLR